MKKKQIKLEVPSEKATFIALSTTLSLHKLSWELNTSLHLKLSQSAGLKHLDLCYPTLKNEEGTSPYSIDIVKNKYESNLLVKELANIDYIVRIQGDMPAEGIKDLVQKIKTIPSVLAAIRIDASKIKGLAPMQNL
jgi:hypothetical protein